MLTYFKSLSIGRSGWMLLTFSALVLELIALYFQHGMGLNPCVMCIYERVALWGIFFAGIIGMLAPRIWLLRCLAIIIGLVSAIKGLSLSIKHVDYQLNPSPWNQCSYLAEFPDTLPLDKWFPFMFNPTGSCSDIVWSFLGLSMAQWIVVMFAFYSLLLAIILISQIKRGRPKQRALFR